MTNTTKQLITFILTTLALVALMLGGAVAITHPIAPASAGIAMHPTNDDAAGHVLHQGWGKGNCTDDEWFYGYGCMHIDAMNSNDPRLNMTTFDSVIPSDN